LPCTLAWKRLELTFGSWCLREGAIVLKCSNAGQGLKLDREQVEALRPVDNAFGQLDPSSSRH
jgi:hypothetical protein